MATSNIDASLADLSSIAGLGSAGMVAADIVTAVGNAHTKLNGAVTKDDLELIVGLSASGLDNTKVLNGIQKGANLTVESADIATAVTEAKNISGVFVKTKNMYDYSTRNEQTYLSGSGTLNVNKGNSTSDYIAVEPGQSYIIKYAGRISLYNAEKVFVTNLATNTFSLSEASSTRFIRFSSSLTNMDENSKNQMELGSTITSFEPYGTFMSSSNLIDIDSKINTVINAQEVKPIVGTNLYDKTKRTLDYKVDHTTGALAVLAGYSSSDYIEVEEGQDYIATYNSFCAFYDESKVFISGAVSALTFTPPAGAKYFRFSSSSTYMGDRDKYPCQLQKGTIATKYEEYKLAYPSKNINVEPVTNILTASIDEATDFVGRRAIQDAIDSILDATATNRYEIHVSPGVYTASTTAEFDMNDYGYCFIQGKKHVDIIGKNRDEVIIVGSLPDNLGTSFAYYSYQPVYFNTDDAMMKDLTIIARNCRYPVHIDNPEVNIDCTEYFKNCRIVHEGNYGDAAVVWTSYNPIGLGMASGQKLIVEDCEVSYFSSHDNNDFEKESLTLYKNCSITGRSDELGNIIAQASSIGGGKKSKLVAEGCNVSGVGRVIINATNSSTNMDNQPANRISMELEMKDTYPFPIDNASVTGTALKITSLSTGGSSTVRFDETSTAFADIIGHASGSHEYDNRNARKTVNGYEFFDGGDTLSGYAISSLHIGEELSYTKLGARLGDCSTTSKTLTVVVDGTSYDIIFNTDLSSATNTTVIGLITAVIGSVATVEEYILSKDYFPEFKGLTIKENSDSTAILAGMGLVFTSWNSVRKATNADGKVDAIALDDAVPGGKVRIIQGGYIYSMASTQRFSTLETVDDARVVGDELGISATAGVFELGATPTILRCVVDNILAFKVRD